MRVLWFRRSLPRPRFRLVPERAGTRFCRCHLLAQANAGVQGKEQQRPLPNIPRRFDEPSRLVWLVPIERSLGHHHLRKIGQVR